MTISGTPPLHLVQPGRINFGCGVAGECSAELARLGSKRAAFVVSTSAAKLAQPLLDAAIARGLHVSVVTGIPPEPTVADFERVRAQVREFAPDVVIGFGGGSVLDVAKLAAALHDRNEPVGAFFGIGLLPARKTHLVCLPTTAGTGSEVSPNAVLYDEGAQLKMAVISPSLVPDAAFVDPDLTVTVPPALTAATGLDAFTHCVEAYANRFAHPFVDTYALEGIRRIANHLPRAVRDGADIEARTHVALGSLYGGLCLGPVNTAAVHALAYPLGSRFRMAHGLSNALLLPHVLRFNLEAAPARYAAIALALGASPGRDDRETAGRGVEKIHELSLACELSPRLSAHGVSPSAIPELAEAAMKVTRLLKNNPRTLTRDDAERIYREAC